MIKVFKSMKKTLINTKNIISSLTTNKTAAESSMSIVWLWDMNSVLQY